jgi:hypothetical protein
MGGVETRSNVFCPSIALHTIHRPVVEIVRDLWRGCWKCVAKV